MMKRRKSTESRLKGSNPEKEEDTDQEDEEMINSMPVGRKLAEAGRRVTFRAVHKEPITDAKKLRGKSGSILRVTSRSRSFHKKKEKNVE